MLFPKILCIFAETFNKSVVMAQVELRLSGKIQPETGRSEVMIRFFYTKHDFYAKSGVFINPEYFEYYIDRKKTVNPKKPIPQNKLTARKDDAEKNGWVLRNSGLIVTSNRQVETEDVKFHKDQSKKIDDIKKMIVDTYETADKESLTTEWLKDIIDRYNHPEKYEKAVKTFYQLAEEFLSKPHGDMQHPIAESHARVYRVLVRSVARYEGFVREIDADRKGFVWDINTVTQSDLKDFFEYLKNEYQLSQKYPKLFERLLANYPLAVTAGKGKLEERGENTIIKMKTRLKTLFKYFFDEGYTTNRPFEGMKIGTEIVGTPIYITIAERNQIAKADLGTIWEGMSKEDRQLARMPIKTLIEQRDIFIFHCFVGCRVGDLIKLTERHIEDGVLVYTPHKTKDAGEDAAQARVPLHPKALELIEKYRGVDPKGRLFPFITPQRYNDAIKCFFGMAGVKRNVEIRNPKTGENEIVPINTIASSHLARRTFVGNLYFKVQDPNLIGKMSGHVEGSEAFKRYRKIEDVTLRETINLLD